jgi:hypothetical protein
VFSAKGALSFLKLAAATFEYPFSSAEGAIECPTHNPGCGIITGSELDSRLSASGDFYSNPWGGCPRLILRMRLWR